MRKGERFLVQWQKRKKKAPVCMGARMKGVHCHQRGNKEPIKRTGGEGRRRGGGGGGGGSPIGGGGGRRRRRSW